MELIGIIATFIICIFLAIAGFSVLQLAYGFGSCHKSDYIWGWILFLGGIVGVIATWYFNIDIKLKG